MYSIHCHSDFAQRFWWCAPDFRYAPHFRLEMQETACNTKRFQRRRKVTLWNGIVLNTRWYTPPKIDPPANRSMARDVTLSNGIVLRATTYRPPRFPLPRINETKEVQAMDRAYLKWLAERDAKKGTKRQRRNAA